MPILRPLQGAQGGKSLAQIFTLTDTGSEYTINTGAGAVLTMPNITNFSYDGPAGTMTFDQLSDTPDFGDFMLSHARMSEPEDPESVFLTNGQEVIATVATGGDGTLVLCINYGAQTSGKVKVTYAIGYISMPSFTEENGQFSRPSVEITPIGTAPYELNVTSVLIKTDIAGVAEALVDAAATITIAASKRPSGWKFVDTAA